MPATPGLTKALGDVTLKRLQEPVNSRLMLGQQSLFLDFMALHYASKPQPDSRVQIALANIYALLRFSGRGHQAAACCCKLMRQQG